MLVLLYLEDARIVVLSSFQFFFSYMILFVEQS